MCRQVSGELTRRGLVAEVRRAQDLGVARPSTRRARRQKGNNEQAACDKGGAMKVIARIYIHRTQRVRCASPLADRAHVIRNARFRRCEVEVLWRNCRSRRSKRGQGSLQGRLVIWGPGGEANARGVWGARGGLVARWRVCLRARVRFFGGDTLMISCDGWVHKAGGQGRGL